MGYIERKTCRVCGSGGLESVLSLGEQYVINFLDSPTRERPKAPLDLVKCPKCSLVQLRHTVNQDSLFRKYWYKSGVNQSMRETLAGIAKQIETVASLTPDDIIVDIGSNDGTMLRAISRKCVKVGFEPATNIVDEIINEGKGGIDYLINDYFCAQAYWKYLDKKARAITAVAMFYDLNDPNAFVGLIKEVLEDDGVFLIQMNYLAAMLANNAFDNILHEHLEYYSLTSLKYLLDKHGLEIFDVELNQVNGGSFKVLIKHKGCERYPVKPTVEMLLGFEKRWQLDTLAPYQAFAERIKALKEETVDFIKCAVEDGQKVYVYGASTRGNTLLQYYALGNDLLPKAAERNPAKYGLFTTTGIPIVSEDEARKDRPEYFLVLPYHFAEEFVRREREYLKSGGKLIIPLPEFRVVGA